VSSILVLAAGLISKFINEDWTKYLDPISSLLIVALIMFTTLPLLRDCSSILLQQAPSQVKIPSLKEKLLKVDCIQGIHDLHVWQLVDNLIIASVHASVYNTDAANFKIICASIKKVMHKFEIHSSTVQLEFIHNENIGEDCEQNCVRNCLEESCCKSEKSTLTQYTTFPSQSNQIQNPDTTTTLNK